MAELNVPLRIAHLIETDGPGGAERVVANLARTLQGQGLYNVVVVPSEGEGWLATELAGSGVAVEHFEPVRTRVSRGTVRSLTTIFKRHRIDVAHSHEFTLAVYGSWAALVAGVRHVITMHGGRYYADEFRRRLALRAAVACSSCTVAVSNSVARYLSSDLLCRRTNIVTIPNGVAHAPVRGSTLREELKLGSDDRLLVAVGNLYPVKGHRYLIEAVAAINQRHPNVHLAICGRGDLATSLIAQAQGLGIEGKLHLLGLRADIPAVLAGADVFVHPSLSEGLPLALLEAMFAARPIVASNVGEIAEALGGGTAGIVVNPADPRALANAIEELLSAPARARSLGERASARALAEYDISQMVRRYFSVYENVHLSMN